MVIKGWQSYMQVTRQTRARRVVCAAAAARACAAPSAAGARSAPPATTCTTDTPSVDTTSARSALNTRNTPTTLLLLVIHLPVTYNLTWNCRLYQHHNCEMRGRRCRRRPRRPCHRREDIRYTRRHKVFYLIML